jgi:hypothetical protein
MTEPTLKHLLTIAIVMACERDLEPEKFTLGTTAMNQLRKDSGPTSLGGEDRFRGVPIETNSIWTMRWELLMSRRNMHYTISDAEALIYVAKRQKVANDIDWDLRAQAIF